VSSSLMATTSLPFPDLDHETPLRIVGNAIRYVMLWPWNLKFFYVSYSLCDNLNIRFATKCVVQGPMRPRVCLGVKHTLTNGGECKGWSPMTPKCIPTLGVTLVWELRMFGTLVIKVNKHQIGPLGHH
jgi:hypothetical protein